MGKPLQLDPGVGCGELPISLGMLLVADLLPGIHFLDQGLLVGDTSVETLRGQAGEFGFYHIEPPPVFGRVGPREPLEEAAFLCGGKSLAERSRFVSAEIILHEDDFRGAGKWMSDNSLRTGA